MAKISTNPRRPGEDIDEGSTTTHFRANIRRLRVLRGWSAATVAGRMYMGDSQDQVPYSMTADKVLKIEAGRRRPTVDDLTAFAVAFNVSPWMLVVPWPDVPQQVYTSSQTQERYVSGGDYASFTELWRWARGSQYPELLSRGIDWLEAEVTLRMTNDLGVVATLTADPAPETFTKCFSAAAEAYVLELSEPLAQLLDEVDEKWPTIGGFDPPYTEFPDAEERETYTRRVETLEALLAGLERASRPPEVPSANLAVQRMRNALSDALTLARDLLARSRLMGILWRIMKDGRTADTWTLVWGPEPDAPITTYRNARPRGELSK
jgi:transcriptional regulator with XRE-family HTH domain